MKPFSLLLLLALAASACEKIPPSASPPPTTPKALVAHFECNRCHVAKGTLEPAPIKKNCVGCHRAIHQGLFDQGQYDQARVDGWKKSVHHLLEVPSLTGAAVRFRRQWFEAFIQNPHDLRPRIGAQMPRLRITPTQAALIADYFWIDAPAPPSSEPPAGDPVAGRRTFESKGCTGCHVFTGPAAPPLAHHPSRVSMPPEQLRRATLQAPDLRHTRDRMHPATTLRWLEDPASIKSDSLMPTIPLTQTERHDLVAFLHTTPLSPPLTTAPPAPLPLLTRPVSYAEVESRVFKKVCWHCHSDPQPVQGDGGPGNTGGLGFRGLGVDFSSRDAVLRGGMDAKGQKIDLLAKNPQGTPHLVTHLLLRHDEVHTGITSDSRGMPLGLPPMTMEEIQLVATWIEQGAPP